jgi:hypothetical protein
MIKELENTKLIRELNYLRSEYDYKHNLIQSFNIEFFKWIESILSINSELKEIYESNRNSKINQEKIDTNLQENRELEKDVEFDSKIKDVYRKIVKITHPDKVKSDALHLLYNEANLALEEGSSIDILLICDRLGLSYEISDGDRENLKKEISDIKNKIQYLESSFVYQWYLQEDENIKNKIALNYIKNSIF